MGGSLRFGFLLLFHTVSRSVGRFESSSVDRDSGDIRRDLVQLGLQFLREERGGEG